MADSAPNPAATVQETVKGESGSEEEVQNAQGDAQGATNSTPVKKKKKSNKKKKVASALGLSSEESANPSKPKSSPSEAALQQVLGMNPALRGEMAGMQPEQAQKLLRSLNIREMLTGMSLTGDNTKDMASYKFWSTQPVPRLDESKDERQKAPDGQIKPVVKELVPKEPSELLEGFEWVELDLTDEKELQEVHDLLNLHYVEDAKAMFRFAYSYTFLDWALKAPGWKKCWHVGIRAKTGKRALLATIFGIPTKVNVRGNILDVAEINFLCVHKKLRSKRLAPVLIKEVTRRCYLEGIYQAIYTGGTLLPTPVSTCRYFHRSIQWTKLYEVGFSALPPKMTVSMMVNRFKLPAKTSTRGWRPMEEKDIDSVYQLLMRYLARFEIYQDFTREEISHWFVNRQKDTAERVVWSFVVEDPVSERITDFCSFYNLESTIVGEASTKHAKIRAAYTYYYATEAAFENKGAGLKDRLDSILGDLLIEARDSGFDVVNTLTFLDNPLVLRDLKFGAGDGRLHYYLYNWRTSSVHGGINQKSEVEQSPNGGGMGMIML